MLELCQLDGIFPENAPLQPLGCLRLDTEVPSRWLRRRLCDATVAVAEAALASYPPAAQSPSSMSVPVPMLSWVAPASTLAPKPTAIARAL